jgi:hypothetical protein
VKIILYGHAWLSGALTAFAFFGFWRATGGFNAVNTTRQAWAWAAIFAIGLLWTVLGFSYVARRDSEGAGGDDLEGPAPAPGAGRPAEEVAGPSRPRGAPAKYAAPLLVLLTFLAVAVLLAAAAGWWPSPTTTRPPFVNTTAPGRR